MIFVFFEYSHVSNFHIDMVLFNVIPLQQNQGFKFLGAILSQHLVAREWHLVPVFYVVECSQCVSDEATFS